MSTYVKYIVFTDASCRRYGDKSYCGYGVVILNTETRAYTEFGGQLSGRSTVFCEAWAIYQGLKKMSELTKDTTDVNVLLVTDSKLNVQILCDWIPIWNLKDWMHWKKRDGSVVKNQDLYRRIVELLYKSKNMNVRITHVNSHLSAKDWPKIAAKLSKYRVYANEITAKMFMAMNGKADEIATAITATSRDTDAGYFQLKRRKDVE